MKHNYLSYNKEMSYSIGSNANYILVQLQDADGKQIRVPLTIAETSNLIDFLKAEIEIREFMKQDY